MKKSVVIIACVTVTLLHSMEEQLRVKVTCDTVCSAAKRVDFKFYDTKIIVCKGSIIDAGDTVDVIVMGDNQQQKLSRYHGFGSEYQIVGQYYFHGAHCVHEKSKTNAIKSKEVKSAVLVIAEPCITITQGFAPKLNKYGDIFKYSTTRMPISSSNVWGCYAFTAKGEGAIVEASKDLENCYMMALKEGLTKGKNIALTMLSVDCGFPEKKASAIAVKAVVDYINNNKNDSAKTYDQIFLYVTRGFEFIDYQEKLLDMIDT